MPYVLIAILIVLVVAALVAIAMRRRRPARQEVGAIPPPPAPPWAEFFSPEEYDAFIAAVSAYFRHGGIMVRIHNGTVRNVDADDKTGEPGLSNLAGHAIKIDRGAWGERIRDHFDSLESARQQQDQLDERKKSLDNVRDLLAVRIGPAESFPRDSMIWREDLPGTISYVVLDLPTTMQTVHPKDAAAWGVSHDDLFLFALANIQKTCIPDSSRQSLGEVHCTILTGASFFVATHALLLKRHHDCIGAHGSLVAIPHRHALLAYPINDLEVVKAVHVMALVARGMEKEGPGSISPRLYWWRDGGFIDLPYEVVDETFRFSPPDEFLQELNSMAENLPAGSV